MPEPAVGNPQAAIRIGTRGSKLALAQANAVAEALGRAWPALSFEIVSITTTGDRRAEPPLPAIGGQGLFTREIEKALLGGDVELAVHSHKDLPTTLEEGLLVSAVPPRAPANDCLITADGRGLTDLPDGARVGTSSPRRAAQLLRLRPGLRIEPIRGNLDSRLRKLREGHTDALCLALAGLIRLGLDGQASEVLPLERMLPAPAQGALAVEIDAVSISPRKIASSLARSLGNRSVPTLRQLTAAINDPVSLAATVVERAVLRALGGGCSLPLGAHAEPVHGNTLRLRAILLSPDGTAAACADRTGIVSEPGGLAKAVAHDLRADGADRILDAIQGN